MQEGKPIKFQPYTPLVKNSTGYESPIQIAATAISTEFDHQMGAIICKAVQGVGVDVNKYELMQALAYDRQQYKKGYEDGVRDIIERLKKRSMYDFYAHGVSYSNEFLDSLLMEAICGTLKDGDTDD